MNSYNKQNEKVIVITGGTSGVGKAVAKELAKMKAKIIVIARNNKLMSEVKEEIIQYSNNTEIEFIQGNLASLESTRLAAEKISKKYPKINVLINNACSFHNKRVETEDGLESTFEVCYLSHFLLVLLLLDNLKAGTPSRIINLTSDIHLFFGLKIKDLQQKKRYRSQKAYGNAKAAMVLHAFELHKRLKDSGITANAFHPGKVLTNMITENLPKFLIKMKGKHISPEEAAKPLVYLAISDEVADISGKYFRKFDIGKSSKQSLNTHLQEELWKKSLKLIQNKISDFKSPI
jgi:NAD(P)-dependent dehydrogenase (short-subunit alcohol dehydrogenase family)